jgi:hypothetical protein
VCVCFRALNIRRAEGAVPFQRLVCMFVCVRVCVLGIDSPHHVRLEKKVARTVVGHACARAHTSVCHEKLDSCSYCHTVCHVAWPADGMFNVNMTAVREQIDFPFVISGIEWSGNGRHTHVICMRIFNHVILLSTSYVLRAVRAVCVRVGRVGDREHSPNE